MSHQTAALQLVKQEKFNEAAQQLSLWTKAGNWKDDPEFYDVAAAIHEHNGHTDAAKWNWNKARELRGE